MELLNHGITDGQTLGILDYILDQNFVKKEKFTQTNTNQGLKNDTGNFVKKSAKYPFYIS